MGRGNIIIVEDDNIVAENIKKHLSKLGYDIIDIIPAQGDCNKFCVNT